MKKRISRERSFTARELLLMQVVAEAANEAVKPHEAIQVALDRVCSFTKWPLGHAWLLENIAAPVPVCVHVWSGAEDARFQAFRALTEAQAVVSGVDVPGEVLKSREAVWVENLSGMDFPRREAARTAGLKSALAIPVLVGGEIAAVLEFFSDRPARLHPRWMNVFTHISSQLRQVIERAGARRALQIKEEYFRRLTENALDIITILNGDGTIRFESQSVEQSLGYKPDEYVGKNAFEFVHPDDLPAVIKSFSEALQKQGNTQPLTFRFRHKDGSWRMLEGVGNNLLRDPVVAGIVFNSRDITERMRLEEQYLQSQKVAVVGRLAGGVAHDFNNILTAIMGYSELMLRSFDRDNPFYGSIVEIKKAADRAAGLTSQLLAFSRKQVLSPKVINLNEVIANMDKMLRRLIGEDIDLLTVPRDCLGRVKADPGQIEQVILNLVVNARDAMPNGGRVTIETDNVTLDEEYARGHVEVTAGPHVMLAVSDTGLGMSKEVQSHLFEPFFTTKEKGKGTGLGLPTCHGIVKQSGGHISVYSEEGKGTAFKVYLPRVEQESDIIVKPAELPELARGSETLLLVEDEPVLRELVGFVLRDSGYRVMEARDGNDALRVVNEHVGKIDMLVTDVIMPGMGGKELADQLRAQFPDTKILFCSGYTEDAIIHHGVLDAGIAFLQKPFTPAMLLRKVRDAFDTMDR